MPVSKKPRHPQKDASRTRTLSGKPKTTSIGHDPWAVPDAEKAKRVEPKARTGEFYQRPEVPESVPIVLEEKIGLRSRRRRARQQRGGLKGFSQPSGSARRNKPEHWLAKAKRKAASAWTDTVVPSDELNEMEES